MCWGKYICVHSHFHALNLPPSLPFFIIGFGVGLYVVIVHSCAICMCLGWLVFCSNSYVLFNCQEIEESNEALEDCSRLIEELHCWAWEKPQTLGSQLCWEPDYLQLGPDAKSIGHWLGPSHSYFLSYIKILYILKIENWKSNWKIVCSLCF